VIEARRTLSHAPERVFAFLSDIRNHWRLEDAFIDLDALERERGGQPTGGRVRIRGPLGLSRVARTRVLSADPPAANTPGRLLGLAEVGRVTIGRVGWEIADVGNGGSDVRLWAEVERASVPDRLMLALGGRRYLGAIFRRAVANLSRELDAFETRES
jgi:hypothetical protein